MTVMMSENKGFVGGPQRKLQEKRRIRREEEIRKYKVLDVYDKQRTATDISVGAHIVYFRDC